MLLNSRYQEEGSIIIDRIDDSLVSKYLYLLFTIQIFIIQIINKSNFFRKINFLSSVSCVNSLKGDSDVLQACLSVIVFQNFYL